MLLWALLGVALADSLYSQSALPLVSGFDEARLQSVHPLDDEQAVSELAKLLYRLARIDPQRWRQSVPTEPTLRPGEMVRFDGTVITVRPHVVPAALQDVLEMATVFDIEIQSEQSTIDVLTAQVDSEVVPGDRVSGWGVIIKIADHNESSGGRPAAVATVRLQWFPATVDNDGWKLLRDAEVDIAAVSRLAARNRSPLQAADADAFYSMLAAAASIGDRASLPEPATIDPVTLLRTPQSLIGQWMQLDLETVQVSKVLVTDPGRQQQLGRDHYFQIDAVGELGNVVIRIDPSDPQGQSAMFADRYPISVVTAELPDFLRRQLEQSSGRDPIVTPLRTKIRIDGFFFRLWSYASHFMDQHGGDRQIGPLLIAASITDREPPAVAATGVEYIGAVAAVVVIGGIMLIFWWQRRQAAGDRSARQARRRRASEELEFPPRST